MKNNSLIILLYLALASCQKNNSVSPVLTDENHFSLAVVTAAASSVTVNTESALKSAVSTAKAGDIITISGTIKLTSTLQLLNSGTSSSKINLTGGVLDCSGISSGWGVKCNGSYWNITNMTIKNAPDCGLVFQYGGYNYVYNVTTSGNHDSGLQIYNQSHHNNISYCNSNDNYDTQNGGENADGFACKLSAGQGNKFDHCKANHNSDDGWDLYGQPYTVTITNCTATNNGYGGNGDGNGFKLGSSGQNVAHTVTNCTSSYNMASGYDGNGNTGHITTTGSTGTGNGKTLFYRIY
ncbi:right-handed parallel beta-helix repeat-containing protein [Chitinophaga filiformis]|uniref:Right handed beta helix region n=1 Tax=Chitinophaga filiformis TaxID=104663 RepID=A0A1G7Y6A4_CHIFI|nr:right-handed parallel beta-helix repeat-containing protein [Chitinophaga filiformis]SDG91995.1 Right handed beta helix region [Chitinophaga filiformis]